jgi:hypothetical protein
MPMQHWEQGDMACPLWILLSLEYEGGFVLLFFIDLDCFWNGS